MNALTKVASEYRCDFGTEGALHESGGLSVPFRKYVDAFGPEVLDAMTAAFNTALQSAKVPLSECAKREIADSIIERASGGVRDVSELTKVALATASTNEEPCGGEIGGDEPLDPQHPESA
jgi:hypothetical protein